MLPSWLIWVPKIWPSLPQTTIPRQLFAKGARGSSRIAVTHAIILQHRQLSVNSSIEPRILSLSRCTHNQKLHVNTNLVSSFKLPNTRKKRALKFKVCRKIFQIEFSLCNKLWLYHCFTLMAAPKFHKCPSQPPTDAISVGPRNAGCGVLAAWASWQLSRV